MIQRQNWVFEFRKYIEKLENRYDRFFTRCQKHLKKKWAAEWNRKIYKKTDLKRKMKSLFFEQVILSKDEMDKLIN